MCYQRRGYIISDKEVEKSSSDLKEVEQEKKILDELNELHDKKAGKLEKNNIELQKKLTEESMKVKGLEQEKMILEELNEFLSSDAKELENSKNELERKISTQQNKSKEIEQEKNLLDSLNEETQKRSLKLSKKYYLSIVLIVTVVSATFVGYSYYQNELLVKTTSEFLKNYNSRYLIQNLKGDTVDTWISWRLPDGRVINVNIINKADVSDEAINAIKESILSTQGIEIDDSLLHKGPQGSSSTYYKGWAGALEKATVRPTEFYIPTEFKVTNSNSQAGDVVITLVKEKDPDGYSGFTQSITDNNQILKSSITIYEADKITKEQMGVIIRHEFGHAIGLAHSTAPEDLMAPIIKTGYPYISDCDINAIQALYDGKKTSQVVCEK